MEEHVDPVEREAIEALDERGSPRRRPTRSILIELRERASGEGLWNLFLPDERFGPGLTNWEYGMLCEQMGRSGVAPMAFNCSAPDTGNAEILAEHGTDEQKERWLAAAARRRDPQLLLDDRARDRGLRSHPARRRARSSRATSGSSTATSGSRRATTAPRSRSRWWSPTPTRRRTSGRA